MNATDPNTCAFRGPFRDPFAPRRSPRFNKSREELRELARKNNVRRGRNTMDTVRNLRSAGVPID